MQQNFTSIGLPLSFTVCNSMHSHLSCDLFGLFSKTPRDEQCVSCIVRWGLALYIYGRGKGT